MDLRNNRDIRELRDMAREDLNKDPDNRTMRLRQEAAQKNLINIYLHPDYVTQQNIALFSRWQVKEATDKKIVTTRICQQLQEIGGKLRASLSTLTSSATTRLVLPPQDGLSWMIQEPEEWDNGVD